MHIKDFRHFIQVIKKIPTQETTAIRVYLNLSPKLYTELESKIKPGHRFALAELWDDGIENLVQMFGKIVYICDSEKKGKSLSIDYTRTFDL